MKILSIETSCDETAISIIEAKQKSNKVIFKVLANNLASQINIHKKYGGVFPMLAKREHSKNLFPLLWKSLNEANLLKPSPRGEKLNENLIKKILDREIILAEKILAFLPSIKKPNIDLIAVTTGPGLEPALWVGINLAKALEKIWGIKTCAINHMEGHIFSVFINNEKQFSLPKLSFPSIALLISGGHTEIVLIKDWLKYKVIGQTRDDAAGEAFDKVARMLNLPYPGGPEISKLAGQIRDKKRKNIPYPLPRPMINTKDFDFSFSGLKTAVLYTVKKIAKLTPQIKKEIALEFENAVTEVLISKTFKAIKTFEAKNLIIGGGVSANKYIRSTFAEKLKQELPKTNLYLPLNTFSTDNSLMIGVVAYFQSQSKKIKKVNKAEGNLSF